MTEQPAETAAVQATPDPLTDPDYQQHLADKEAADAQASAQASAVDPDYQRYLADKEANREADEAKAAQDEADKANAEAVEAQRVRDVDAVTRNRLADSIVLNDKGDEQARFLSSTGHNDA